MTTEPAVTIALPTYGRPDALVCAIGSVLRQTRRDWRLIVVGDRCNDDTAAAIAPFLRDPRVRYVNLAQRCGEQALLNSAVMATANTPYIALLNHDDLWLPDHLALACRRLQQDDVDFFLGRSAWSWGEQDADGLPGLSCLSPEPRDPLHFFLSGVHYVEPASAWVITRELAQRVGPWRAAATIFRTPIQDWALRAWAGNARLGGARKVTCLKFENHWRPDSLARRYDTPAAPQQALAAAIGNPAGLARLEARLQRLDADPAAVGRGMQSHLIAPNPPAALRNAHALLNVDMARYYRQTGLDAYNWYCAEVGLERGWRWRAALQKRTGENAFEPPTLDHVVAQLAGALA